MEEKKDNRKTPREKGKKEPAKKESPKDEAVYQSEETAVQEDSLAQAVAGWVDSAKSTKFTQDSFSNTQAMVYEKSNAFTLAYYNMTPSAQKLLMAALTCVHHVNRVNPFSQSEKADGFWVSAPITHIARLMGYDVEDKTKKSFYRSIKQAAQQVVSSTVTMEDEGTQSFAVFNVINNILYNPNGDGRVYIHFAGGTSQYYLGLTSNYTMFSLILNQHVTENGNMTAVRLAEILKTNLFRAKNSPDGKVTVYYDYVDLRCMLSMINVKDPKVTQVLKDKKFDNYLSNNSVAYARGCEIDKLDDWLSSMENGAYAKSRRTSKFGVYSNFVKRVLAPAQKAYIECIRDYPDLMDMMFEYEPVHYKGKAIGINFTIYTIEAYVKKEREQGVQMSLSDFMVEGQKKDRPKEKIGAYEDTSMYEVTQVDVEQEMQSRPKEKPVRKKKFRPAEVEAHIRALEEFLEGYQGARYELRMSEIFLLAQKATADVIIEKFKLMQESSDVREPMAWMTSAIDRDFRRPERKAAPKKSGFGDFEQQEYDFDALEKKLMANGTDSGEK